MNTPMSVSLIITTYNAQAFIMRAIGSALEQTRPPLEIIVVDDCSTDGYARDTAQAGARA
ncbi:glycosyltransferase [Komagataeibacter rhaeticus]|nr:glycosyltransferase [Komagataeibacter rhaeticus]